MGGYGSGRRPGGRQPCCEDYQSIDLAWLRRKGLLAAGRISTPSWIGPPIASFKLTTRRDGVQLAYLIVGDNGERESISEVVAFAETPTARGGSRKWFRCNGCGKGCRILYGGQYFRCRSCHGLRYASQYVPGYQCAIDRANKLRQLLGDKIGNVLKGDPFPHKPPLMRWATYERLEALYNKLDRRWKAEIVSFAAPARTGR
jgi:hypothetical protein